MGPALALALVLPVTNVQSASFTEHPSGVSQPVLRAAGLSAAVSDFKLQLHALVSEALILQLKTPSLESPRDSIAARKIRWDAQSRLSESLRSANALLSMLEIANHSDQGARVREVLLLWLDSSQRLLADHAAALETLSQGASLDASTAEFLEELKILWRRLDSAYAELETALTAPSPDPAA